MTLPRCPTCNKIVRGPPGRPPRFIEPQALETARQILAAGGSWASAARESGIAETTIRRRLTVQAHGEAGSMVTKDGG